MKHVNIDSQGALPGQRRRRRSLAPLVRALTGIVPLLVTATGCGGRESTASKSAAAFEEAAKKGGSPAGTSGETHGGHDASAGAAGASEEMDHSKMPGMDPSASMAGMDHSRATGTRSPGMAGMDHSAMPGMRRSGVSGTNRGGMAGMDHSRMSGGSTPGMAGMNHASMSTTNPSGMAGRGHDMAGMGQMGAKGPMGAPVPEPPLAVARPGQPAATLRTDGIDAPVATAIKDAARADGMSGEMAGMSHGMYRQTDAGRDVVRSPTPITGGHEGHEMAPSTAPPMPAAHGAHGQPASPRSSPTTANPTPAPAPSPAGIPHDMHAMPSPRPQPSPSPGGNQ